MRPRPSALLNGKCGRAETNQWAVAKLRSDHVFAYCGPGKNLAPQTKTAGQLLSRPAVFLLLGLGSLLVELNRVAQTLYSHFLFLRR